MGEATDELSAETVGELLEDEYARAILAETSVEPRSASELVERCDASPPTVYRRLDTLQDHDMIDEETVPSPDGNHYRRFSARFERVTIELRDGSYDVSVDRSEADAVERFARLYEGLR